VMSIIEHDLAVPAVPDFGRQLEQLLPVLAAGRTVHRSPRRVVVTGVEMLEGSPLISANLAITCAAKGFRTLVVDANLHDPTLHELFGVENTRGVSTLLSSTDPPNRLPQPTSVPNLAVIAAGPIHPHGPSLLSTERLFHRLEPIARRFDYLIVDCSMLAPVIAGRVSEGADNILLLARRHSTSMRELQNFLEILRSEETVEPSVLLID
jgi:capsular exopolysaccharide synthesis family protein